jgi:hypothetical protein
MTYTSPIDLYHQEVVILTDQPGPVDSVSHLGMLDPCSGDYTATRQSHPDEGSMADLCDEIRAYEATAAKI